MSKLYNVSASPHIRSKDTTKTIMRDVIIALIPTTLFGIFNFGLNALLVILTSIVGAVLTEYIYEKLMKKKITTSDMSAALTGLLLALNLSSTMPLWIVLLGSIFAILVVKMLFGGLGQNFMNPALAARCFLLISFAGKMTTFSIEKGNELKDYIWNGYAAVKGYCSADAVTTATPLAALKAGESFDILEMFIGTRAGTIGETSIIAILIGAIYLLAKKIISPKIPFVYIGTLVVFVAIAELAMGNGIDIEFLLAHLCGGGLMLGAFFMATDYVTSPITPLGKIVFGILLGIFTGIFRIFGGSAEGVSYAIIICNMLVPLIEKCTMPKAFGKGR